MVYFVQRIDNGLIKIGTTVRLSGRLYSLTNEHKTEMKVLAVHKGGRREEKEFHERFGHLRATKEWFKPERDLTEFIEAQCEPWDGEDEVVMQTVIFRLPPSVREALQRLADKDQRSIAWWVRKVVEAEMRRQGELV